MNALLWSLAGVGVLAGALLLARAWRMREGPRAAEYVPPPSPVMRMVNRAGAEDGATVRLHGDDLRSIREEIRGLHVLRDDIRHVADLLQQGLSGALAAEQPRVSPSRPEPMGGTARDAYRDPVRDARRDPSPVYGGAWQDDARQLGLRSGRDEHTRGSDPAPFAFDSVVTPPAAAQPYEPSSTAAPVEARNDAVVPSDRHPPEAWLEHRGGEREVWLNPRVPLSDAALQRWSTFFGWERREPGARYQATQPAVVASAGTVLRKGTARPL
ncbi:MAG TPA: hypothetical protein VF647_09985 [Longimicrobium sp.]|jgi:hypothetical protein